MKAIILAGGSGSRLYPITSAVSKQLLPVYDKPMIYYPLSVLMLAKIKEVLIISTPQDLPQFEKLLGDGSQWGIQLSYKIQEKPEGIPQAFLIGEEFIGKGSVALILGDNIYYGTGFSDLLMRGAAFEEGAVNFIYRVKNPEDFGVIEFDKDKNIISLEEKPKNPKSDYVVTGLYFYDNTVIEKTNQLKPSARGELEITDLNKLYLKEKKLKAIYIGRGSAWLDTGTCENLLSAGQFIETIEKRQGYNIACLEEIAYNNGWVSKQQIQAQAQAFKNSSYGKYILRLIP